MFNWGIKSHQWQKCFNYLLKMRLLFSIGENIRPLFRFSNCLLLETNHLFCSNEWSLCQPVLTFSAFAECPKRWPDMNRFHEIKVSYGSSYVYDVCKHFIKQHTWFPILHNLFCAPSFARDKAELYYSSEMFHFVDHKSVIWKHFKIYDALVSERSVPNYK